MAPLRPADPGHDPAGALAVRARLTVDLAAAVARRADVLARSGCAGRRLVARRHVVDDLDHHVLVSSHATGCTPALDEYPRQTWWDPLKDQRIHGRHQAGRRKDQPVSARPAGVADRRRLRRPLAG